MKLLNDLIRAPEDATFRQLHGKINLFYNKFKYSVTFDMPSIRALSLRNNQYMHRYLDNRKASNFAKTNLLSFIEIMNLWESPYKLLCWDSSASIFTDDINILQSIADLEYCKNQRYREIVSVASSGSIYLKNSKWKYRLYFKNYLCDENEKNALREFFRANHESISLSPSFYYWINRSTGWMHGNYFVDTSESALITMMYLMMSSAIKGKYDITNEKVAVV